MVSIEPDALGIKLVQKTDGLQAERSPLDSLWQDVQDFCAPDRTPFTRTSSKGDRPNVEVFESTAQFAANELKGALQGLLVSQSTRWFYLSVTDPTLLKIPRVKFWLTRTTEIMESVFASPFTRFYEQNEEADADLVPFGQGQILIEENTKNRTCTFRAIPLNQVYQETDENGFVDSIYRVQKMGLRQIYSKFQDDIVKNAKLDKFIRDMIDQQSMSSVSDQTIIHAVYPREGYHPGKIQTAGNMKYASVYVWKEENLVLRESGYQEFPYAVKRWSVRAGEKYGKGCGVFALSDIKCINKTREVKLRMNNKLMEPSYQAPDGAFAAQVDLRPNRINNYDAELGMNMNGEVIRPIRHGGDPQIAIEEIKDMRETIQKHFYTDLLLEDKRVEMSATESQIRSEERMRIMAPILSRFHTDFMGPLIRRVYGILTRLGAIDDIPPELQGASFKIEYVSPLHKAQRLQDTARTSRFIQDIVQLGGVFPSVIDRINPDGAVDKMVDDYGMSDVILHTDAQVAEIRKQKAQQQAVQFTTEQAQGAAKAAADFSRANPANAAVR